MADVKLTIDTSAQDSALVQILEVIRTMSAQLDALTQKVEQATTVMESARVLITEIKSQLDAAGTDAAALQALSDKLGNETDILAKAVTTNTDADTSVE